MKALFQFKTIVFLAFLSVLASCDHINEKVLPEATGKAGDLLIVMDSLEWNNTPGEMVKTIFAQPQEGLPQNEALFNIIHLQHQHFDKMFKTIRNILFVNINAADKNKITVRKEVWSKDQLVITITAPNQQVAAEIIEKNASNLLQYFNDEEITRLQKKYAVNHNSKNAKSLKEKLDVHLPLDELFVAAQQQDDFMWWRKEKMIAGHQVSQNVLVYTYPYNSDSVFNTANLTAKRNYFTQQYVNGTVDSSYMCTYKEFPPSAREINHKGNYAKVLRGLWHMEGDFMGGPFVNYSMVDPRKNRIVCVDAFVYAPKFDKKEFLREMEAMALSISF